MENTNLVIELSEVSQKLLDLRLTRDGLCKVVDAALAFAAQVTANHPNNSSGTFKYHEGTAVLRDMFLGEGGWVRDSINNIEAIYNPDLAVKVVFQNVENAGLPFFLPQPCSPKKSASRRCIETNSLFDADEIPMQYKPTASALTKTYYLMVSDSDLGSEAELSLVTGVGSNGQFTAITERIFLSFQDWVNPNGEAEEFDTSNDFDFKISRK